MQITLDNCTSYATRANAEKVLARKVPEHVRTLIATRPDGRFVPVAIGQDAVAAGLHHCGILVVG